MYKPEISLQGQAFPLRGVSRPKVALQAFTLVEVAVALGIVAFGLIAIFGLISLSLKYSHDANVQQGLTLAIDQMNSTYQGQNFTNALATLQLNTNYYFDNSGAPLPNATGCYFQCAVTNVTPVNAATNYLALVQLQVSWPYPQMTSTNLSVFSILNSH